MRLLLVDDHPSIRRSLKQLLSLRPEFEVVGEAENGADAIEKVADLRPDVVLIDVNMPVMNGVEATSAIKERHPEIEVLALTAFGDSALVSSMVQAGATGYLLKGGSSTELFESLEAVGKGKGALDKEVTREVMEDFAELYRKEQERADALADLDRMKREFVSIVSHELRTPLTTIKGGTQTLQANWKAIDDRIREELFASILRQSDKLERLVRQIITVSGIQRGGLGLRETEFSMQEVADEAMKTLANRIQGRNVTLDVEEVQATGDKGRVIDVATSLIENALNFTAGSVVITVSAEDGMAKLHVRDEGPGMDQATVARLLESPFTQGDSSSTRSVGGLGLSLYIAKQVLEASRGRLEVDAAPDRGSQFTMVLPLSAS